MRRSVIDVIGDHDVRLYQLQDFDYWIRLCLVTDIYIVQRPLLAYRVSSGDFQFERRASGQGDTRSLGMAKDTAALPDDRG